MVSNFFTLQHIAESLHERLKTATIGDAFSQEKGVLAISFHHLPDFLVVSCRPDASTCYLHRHFARAKRNSVDLFPGIVGEEVVSVSIHPCDRVITLQLASARSLVVQFFGPRSNALLVRSDGIIEDAFKNGRQFIGLRYNAPAGNAFPSLIALRAAFTERGNANVIDALRSAVPPLGPILVKEAVYRAGIPPTCIVSTLIQHTTDTLFQELQGVLDELHAPQPRVYLSDDDSPYMLSLVALKHLGIAHEESFRDIHSAVQRMLARRRSASSFLTKREELRTRLQNLLAKTERTLAAVRHDLQNYDRSIQYQQYGTFLLVHASEVSKGRTSLEMPSGPGPVQIPLDPALTPVQNAQRFFEKAKHARRAQENAHVRVQLLGRRQSMIRELLHSLEATTSREELDQLMTTQKLPLDSLGIGSSQETREHIPFRTFVVDGGFEVWAGKDNANNDLLTLKYARPNDLWFHVRGVSGSHVVLRMATGKGPPGKKAKEQAAGIAAYYSKMRKAGMAPVTMTERKYIRKPKGAPAGTVMVSREETVFATPGLPSTAVLDTGNE